MRYQFDTNESNFQNQITRDFFFLPQKSKPLGGAILGTLHIVVLLCTVGGFSYGYRDLGYFYSLSNQKLDMLNFLPYWPSRFFGPTPRGQMIFLVCICFHPTQGCC